LHRLLCFLRLEFARLCVKENVEFLRVYLGIEAGLLLLSFLGLDVGEKLRELDTLLAKMFDLPLEQGAIKWQFDKMSWSWGLVDRQLREAASASQLLES
jgi:hypothetical protein